MKNYKITVAYDGTKYNGWQKQGNTKNTIQEKFENILERMTGQKVEVYGSGRTDKGVHAKGQVVSVKLDTDFDDNKILEYINKYLPEDISALDICEVDERFHARLSAKRKTYVYRIWNSPIHNAFEHKFLYTVEDELDIAKMQKTAEKFLGEHDFLGFSSVKKTKKSTVRTIYRSKVEKCGNEIKFIVTANGFLYNMVRIMAGTVLEAGLSKREPDSVFEIFETKDRSLAGTTLPGKGLSLLSVEYMD